MAEENFIVIQKDNKDDFNKELNKGKLVIVDFTASWCPPCKMIAPIFKNLAEEYKKVAIFLKVDGDENPEITKEYGISAYPTFFFFKDGKKIDEIVGADKSALEEKIKKYQ